MNYCPNCGEFLSCTNEVEQNTDNNKSKTGWLCFSSIILAITALVFIPPLLGGLGIYLGYKVKKYGNEGTGTTLMIVNSACMILGMFLGAIMSM